MAQADQIIANDTGANVRADINDNIAALFSLSSGSSAPSTTTAYMLWADTNAGSLKIRNGADSDWIVLGPDLTAANLALAPTASPTFTGNVVIPNGAVGTAGLQFTGDADTGFYRVAANQVGITAGGTLSHSFTSTHSIAAVPVQLPDGTAAAPSLTNTGDTDTGIFFGASNEVSFSTGGTERVQVDNNGLTVKTQKEIRFNDSDDSNYVAIKAPATVSSNVTLTLPSSDGDADQYLKTDGAGALSWANVSTPAGVPSGSVFCMATTTVPTGYLECNGAAVSRSTYSDLFSAISTTWGSGDGSTTFNLPDLRGEFVRGWDNSRGVDSSRSFASSQGHQLQEHNHNITAVSQNVGDPPNPITIEHLRSSGVTKETQTSGDTGNFGSETRPRNIAMMYVIKT
jgi:microcystin-dependent protein